MPSKQPNSNSILSDRLYGEHYPDSFLDVPGSLQQSSVATLGDYIQQLREIDNKPNKPCFACEPGKSDESNFQHVCPNNPILTCNCVDPKYCSELGSDPDRQYNDDSRNEAIRDEDRCPNHDGFADNIEYVHIEGQPIPTSPKRQSTVSGWPCIVVGAIPETGFSSGEFVSGSVDSAGDTQFDINAR